MLALTLISATAVPIAAVSAAPPAAVPVEAAARVSAAAASADVIRTRQWWLSALHVTGAWKWSRGRGVTVAVLDTGVDGRHPDLAGQVVTGEDFTGRVRSPGNKYWGRHGSAMASIIAGHGHGSGLTAGVMGIAPQAKILSVRVTWENDDPLRTSGAEADSNRDAVATGIRYAVDHGADVINMSLGGGKLFYNGNPTEEEAIRYALSKGAVLIASAGNDGAGANRKNFPAAYPGVIAVGAVDRNLRPWVDSNRHSYVKVAAPGVDIVSADAGGGYVLGTGTSPSAAIVAGIAALIRSRYPKLTAVQVAQAMEKGVLRGAPAGQSSTVGAGVADAFRALSAAHTINKTAYAGASVRAPLSNPQTVPVADESGPNRLLIGALAGVVGFLIVCLVLARRRRRTYEEYEEYEGYDEEAYEARQRPGEGEPRRSAGAGLNGSPRHGDIAPVNVPPWQSTEALAPAPPPARSKERQVWPPPQETQPAPQAAPQVAPMEAAQTAPAPATGIGGEIGGGGSGGDSGFDPLGPATSRPYDAPATPRRPSGKRARGRERVNEFRLDFGAEPLEPLEPLDPGGSPDDRRTAGFRAVSPDDQQTTAFRVVSPSPDGQPTAGNRMPSPDEQRTNAFRAVSPIPDEESTAGYRLPSPDEQPTAGTRMPSLGDQPRAGYRLPSPDEQPTAGNRMPSLDDQPTAGNRMPPRDNQGTTAFRAVPPVPDQRSTPGDQSGPAVADGPRTVGFGAVPSPPDARPVTGNSARPDERQAAAARAALADRYRRRTRPW